MHSREYIWYIPLVQKHITLSQIFVVGIFFQVFFEKFFLSGDFFLVLKLMFLFFVLYHLTLSGSKFLWLGNSAYSHFNASVHVFI